MSKKKRHNSEKRHRNSVRKAGYLGSALLGLLLVAGVLWATSQPEDEPEPTAATAPGVLEALPASYDFDQVSVRRGEVYATFTLRNNSGGDVVLRDMATSCACTEAAVVVEGWEGPRFNMRAHGSNPRDWSHALGAGETVELRVYYDPRVHAGFRGRAVREVYLFGENLREPLTTVRIYVTQVS